MNRPSAAELSPAGGPGAPAFTPLLRLSGLRAVLLSLAAKPPQALLLEGGTEEERAALARWWAALLNCARRSSGGPCLECPDCLQIGANLHPDVISVDGRISNKEDAENPGPVRALTAERALELRRQLGGAPRGAGRRVVIMAGLEMQSRNTAANALLKILEEPPPHSVFVLTTPQREQLLPTLVSRSWTLTLPWPARAELSASQREWEAALARFLEQGDGWFERSAARGLELSAVQEIVLVCRKALAAALAGRAQTDTARLFASRLDARDMHAATELIGRTQDALQYAVSPGTAADALVTELYVLLRR